MDKLKQLQKSYKIANFSDLYKIKNIKNNPEACLPFLLLSPCPPDNDNQTMIRRDNLFLYLM